MENQQQILIETQFEGLTLYVRPHETHEWLMETRLVAEGYGVSESSIREHKRKNHDELVEGKHFLCVRISDAQIKNAKLGSMVREQTFWTKRGVIRLGFFIKSERAKLFRDWAEDLIIRELEKKEQYVTLEILQKVLSENNKQQDAKMHQYLDALFQMMKKESKETRELIHNLSNRVDKLEKFMLFPHQLEAQKSYTYVCRKIDTNEYKIGKSNEPLDRIQAFENAGTDIKLILTIEFHNSEIALLWEKTLQKTFKELNLKGEWFLLTPKEIQLLLKISAAFEDYYLIR